jgi:hypothetical protein
MTFLGVMDVGVFKSPSQFAFTGGADNSVVVDDFD